MEEELLLIDGCWWLSIVEVVVDEEERIWEVGWGDICTCSGASRVIALARDLKDGWSAQKRLIATSKIKVTTGQSEARSLFFNVAGTTHTTPYPICNLALQGKGGTTPRYSHCRQL